MKQTLLLATAFFILSFTNVKAQCEFVNQGVKLNSTQTSVGGGGCLINIDLSFDLQHNNGNKYVYIHLWPTGSQPISVIGTAPDHTDLANAVATIVIDQDVNPIALDAVYKPDNAVIPQSAGLTITRVNGPTYDRYTITNLSLLTTTACNTLQSFSGYGWATQSSNGKVVHCYTGSFFTFIANDPKAIGSLLCQIPRNYSLTITTVTPSPGISGTYDVYRDNGDGILDAATDALVTNDAPWSATNTTPYQSGAQAYAGNSTSPESNQALFAVVSTAGRTNTIITRMDNGCGPLAVILSDFSTVRNNNTVSLKWETASEININKFEIQKKIGDDFVTISFVNAKNSPNGNEYNFTDNNNSTAVTEYRIKMIDNNGAFKYSDIRVAKGLASATDFTVYPNPSNGATKITISDINAPTNIIISDIAGRKIKSLLNNTSSQIEIGDLKKGIYLIRLTNNNINNTVTKKIIIN